MTKSEVMKEAHRRIARKCAADRMKGLVITRGVMRRYLSFHLKMVWRERPRAAPRPLTAAEKSQVDFLTSQRDTQPVTAQGNLTWQRINAQIQLLTWHRQARPDQVHRKVV